ncbi:MAG: hypothetical protein HKL99_14085 [Burkholderiales bacterium]|nr:hypothetical protein [Burkholderiales bacterium]
MSPIAKAVAPLRAAAIEHAVEMRRQWLDGFIAANPPGTNLATKWPRPHGMMPKAQYMQARNAAAFVRALFATEQCGATRRPGEPEVVVGVNQIFIERDRERTAEAMAANFDAYVSKLERKVGPCDSADIDGRDPWRGSTLTVRKADKIETWKTTQILNVSSLGKLFNQWPTRLMTCEPTATFDPDADSGAAFQPML